MIIEKEKHDFLENCHNLIFVAGEKTKVIILGNEYNGFLYEDELIYIATSEDKKFVEIERKMDSSPIVYIKDDKIIQFHGDYIFLIDHVNNLIK